MKKIIYLAVSALLSFSSCSDFLDKKTVGFTYRGCCFMMMLCSLLM